jgi:CheY-like chemotaxis protein
MIMTDESGQLNVTECVQRPVDVDRLAQILDRAIVRDSNGRAWILHVDDDQDVLEMVAETPNSTAGVVSVSSIEDARYALLLHHFHLVILDVSLGDASGLDLLPDLRRKGSPIPVIIFSAHAAELSGNPQVEANLNKASSSSMSHLVGAVHDRLMLRAPDGPGAAA